MKKSKLLLFGLLLQSFSTVVFGQNNQLPKAVRLPNGWSLSPAGKQLPLGDLPLSIAVSKSKKWAVVTNDGQSTQTLQLIDTKQEKVVDSVVVPTLWGGLAFSADEKYLFASGGNRNRIEQFAIKGGKFSLVDSIVIDKPWPVKISITGIEVGDAKKRLYAVTKENNSLYVIDLTTHKVLNRLDLGAEGYACTLGPNKRNLYISVWGAEKLLIFDTYKNVFAGSIALGAHPNDICITKNEKLLYVSNADDNTVSVVDIQKRKVIESLNAAIYASSLVGSTTNSVALSDDEKQLFVANADNNCVTVFNTSVYGATVTKGFIPTGWYPTCVRVIGNKLFVANGKGNESLANPNGPNPAAKNNVVVLHQGDITTSRKKVQYIGGGLMVGTMSIIDIPNANTLFTYSKAVLNNSPYHKATELEMARKTLNNPIPSRVGDTSPIKYVFYIIKENRTYDQVLGDMSKGNGDTSLVLFGKKYTPNQHAIANQFVLLDNFYVDGEVSSDGHNWSMGAYATDYLEKNWPTSYGRRGGEEISSGQHHMGNSKAGYFWDQTKKYGVTYRTYGEFVNSHGKGSIPSLDGHVATGFMSLNQKFKDTLRASQWIRDFDSLLAIKKVPQFNSVRFGNDHTEGVAAGRPTPFAHVADNDLAVGLFVEHLSKSSIWNESAVFIVEDDAQNGPDHVDAHRTTAYVAGGFVKRDFVDHTPYTTTSMLRTMELILGLPPMTQYDAAATPMYNSFDNVSNPDGFIHLPCNINLNEINPGNTRLSKLSRGLDFSDADEVPDQIMNALLWEYVKGRNVPLPAPRRSTFVIGE
ncbi:MAG TPA: alkaline phosphatase family protein [Mucilaginibacter sp.]|jgi:YVTN family beta-propeller protein